MLQVVEGLNLFMETIFYNEINGLRIQVGSPFLFVMSFLKILPPLGEKRVSNAGDWNTGNF